MCTSQNGNGTWRERSIYRSVRIIIKDVQSYSSRSLAVERNAEESEPEGTFSISLRLYTYHCILCERLTMVNRVGGTVSRAKIYSVKIVIPYSRSLFIYLPCFSVSLFHSVRAGIQGASAAETER